MKEFTKTREELLSEFSSDSTKGLTPNDVKKIVKNSAQILSPRKNPIHC